MLYPIKRKEKVKKMALRVLCNGEEIEANVVGKYGTFGDPIVEINGKTYVTRYVFVDSETNEELANVCLSQGCEYCSGDYTGCRYGEYRDYPKKTVI